MLLILVEVTRTDCFLLYLEARPSQQAHRGAFRAQYPRPCRPVLHLFLVLHTSALDAFEASISPYCRWDHQAKLHF